MTRNPQRRAALCDAALAVLARDGARGLTFRAVDTQAHVPTGTASNYFASRDDLLTQAGRHVYVRMAPDPREVSEHMSGPRTRAMVTELLRWTLRRITDQPDLYLALLELRLEATRRPELRAALTRTIRADLDANVHGHLEAGLPGDRTTAVLLYLAMSGLVIDHLTLPGVLDGEDADQLIAALVTRLVPEEDTAAASER
ncbi:TetR/AcrR family transcriptional regulator [Nocardiopsis gilva YIM 90087]|uniref:TetR/AcrR family transcriptional regulator n=1 Tax=Nocardiopsis gilva YIM 90087 TaxID=1235441 RepID=A0A223S7J8_9ACTN|nr:TetR family transcriptional regulator [Nocardiopsis gilva]ASU84101.1 TetR/AcrR family transcriptional regulator [Nocardiopsis gilva YIM 90087]